MEATTGKLSYRHRSFSQIKQLRKCGWEFKLERIDKVPSRPGAAAEAGKAIHSATEDIDNMLLEGGVARQKMIDTAQVAADLALDKAIADNDERGWPVESYKAFGFRPKQDMAWYRKIGIPNAINAYLDWRLDNPDFELATVPGFGPAIEVPFSYYLGDQEIIGWIDRIFTSRERGGYYPVDIKSGRKPQTDEQLGLYAGALSKALGWEVTWGYYLYELKKGTAKLTPPIRINHWTDEKLGQVYLPATTLIDLGIYIPSPGTDNCMFCGVSDSCAFAQSVV